MNRIKQEEWLLFFFGIALDCDSPILEAILLNGKSEILERKAIESLIKEFLKDGKFNTELPQEPIDVSHIENSEFFRISGSTIYNRILRLTRDVIVWVIVEVGIGYKEAHLRIISRIQPGVFMIQTIFLHFSGETFVRQSARIELIFGGKSFAVYIGSNDYVGSIGEFIGQLNTQSADALARLSAYVSLNEDYLPHFQKAIDSDFRNMYLLKKEAFLVKLLHSLDK